MERLTYKANGNCGFVWAAHCPGASMQDAIDHLAAYEDTGLTPSDIKDMRNELCLLCGKYKEAHNGACDGCRWRKE